MLDHPVRGTSVTLGSIWSHGFLCWAKCDMAPFSIVDYGASSAKPSRMMTSMTNDGFYLGPLRRTSSRVRKTTGRESRTFKTKQTVAWPNTLTSQISKAMLATLAERRPISEEEGTKGPHPEASQGRGRGE